MGNLRIALDPYGMTWGELRSFVEFGSHMDKDDPVEAIHDLNEIHMIDVLIVRQEGDL